MKAVVFDVGNTLVRLDHPRLVDPLDRRTDLDRGRIAALHELPAWLDRAT